MIRLILLSLVLGFGAGYAFLTPDQGPLLDTILMNALNIMIFVSGIEIGENKALIRQFVTPRNLSLCLAIPAAITLGSLTLGTLFGLLTGLPSRDSLLVSAGMGWYSLSSVVIGSLYSTKVGAIAFIANSLRELLCFISVPLLTRWYKFPCIGLGGASTMDSTMPVLLKYINTPSAILGFVSGFLLTLEIPFLLTFLMP